MTSALIGHTGFVGATLNRANRYDDLFNSTSIDSIRGQSFDLLVCAGVSAVKWKANSDPKADLDGIRRLTDAISEVRANRVVLISTVDVYPDPVSVDEHTPIDHVNNHPYGRHRLELEQWVRQKFDNVTIIRLPALFGAGLKKNIIFDMMNANAVDAINSASSFQWYDLEWLTGDMDDIVASGPPLINLVVEPLVTADIQKTIFPKLVLNFNPDKAVKYDVHSRYTAMKKRNDHYMYSAIESLDGLRKFVKTTTAR